MFKNRIVIWFILIIFVLTYRISPYLINKINEEPNIKTINVFINEYNNIVYNIEDKYDKIYLKYSYFNPDYIITNNKIEPDFKEFDKNEYNKIEKYLYSPYIIISNNDLKYNKKNLMFEKDNILNLKIILLAIENNSKYTNLEDYNNSQITLYIPNENSGYYKDILDLMILTLNDFKEPNQQELKILSNRVYSIIDKCEKFENFKEIEIENQNILILTPEIFISESYEDYNKWYLTNTFLKFYDFYYKKNEQIDIFKNILEYNQKFFNNFNLRNDSMKYNPINNSFINFKENILSNIYYYPEIFYNEEDSKDLKNKEEKTFKEKINESGAYIKINNN